LLLRAPIERAAHPTLIADLETNTVQDGDITESFSLDAFARRMLLEGLDPISLTLQTAPDIAAFQAADRRRPAPAATSSPKIWFSCLKPWALQPALTVLR
jgi:3-isopropylmalate dehydratase small subunit